MNIPSYVQNESAYIAATQAHIRRNASIGRKRRFLEEYEDAQKVVDWLTISGEYCDRTRTKDPEDQDVFEKLYAETDCEYARDELWYHYGCRNVIHPMCEGMNNEFIIAMRNAFYEWGSLTEGQMKSVRSSMERREKWLAERDQKMAEYKERDSKSEFVGNLKERRDWVLEIRNVMSFDGQWGVTYINIMNDEFGNIIIGKGSKKFGDKGTTVKVKATIVKHDVRDGVKQTFINRPKF